MSGRWTVVLAGGQGTRLWPLSTPDRPKQLLSWGRSGALVRQSVARAPTPPERTLVLTAGRWQAATAQAIPELPAGHVISEPSARHTAAAVALAVAAVRERGGQSLAVVPADHFVADALAYQAALRRALSAAETSGGVCLVGLQPTSPATHLGWMQTGAVHEGLAPVLAFVEKPDAATAARLLAQGDHLWNAGVFCGTVEGLTGALLAHLPGCGAVAQGHGAWSATEQISFDHGVLERLTGLTVAPLHTGWDDLGTWPALMAQLPDHGGARGLARSVQVEGPGGHEVWAPEHTVLVAGDTPLRVVLKDGLLFVAPVATPVKALRQRLESAEEDG